MGTSLGAYGLNHVCSNI